MKKVLAVGLLCLLIGISIVMADQTVAFQVQIIKDTTISMPALCENGGSVAGTLEFAPGITQLYESDARPVDGCGDGTYGDYNITNDGNTNINLTFSLDAVDTGVTVAIGHGLDYNTGNYVSLVTTGNYQPSWAQSIDPLSSDTVQVWQRIGADDTATGGDTYSRQITITSSAS